MPRKRRALWKTSIVAIANCRHLHRAYTRECAKVVALSGRGIRLGLCSNKPAMLCRKVPEETALTGFFEAVVGGDTLDQEKPRPEPLVHVIDLLASAVTSAILVGDSTVDQRYRCRCWCMTPSVCAPRIGSWHRCLSYSTLSARRFLITAVAHYGN